jgi:CDGSH-type Zn-finger protein
MMMVCSIADQKMVKVRIGNSLKVIGEFLLVHEDGTEEVITDKRSFCRCSLSASMPYCDQTHKKYEVCLTKNLSYSIIEKGQKHTE